MIVWKCHNEAHYFKQLIYAKISLIYTSKSKQYTKLILKITDNIKNITNILKQHKGPQWIYYIFNQLVMPVPDNFNNIRIKILKSLKYFFVSKGIWKL
jgi:hypothetical protein